MNSTEYNRLVREAARTQELRGVPPRPGLGRDAFHWGVRFRREDGSQSGSALGGGGGGAPAANLQRVGGGGGFGTGGGNGANPRLWRIYVGPGTVNDQMAAMTYKTSGDPRGWQMPDGYAQLADAVKIYGANPPLVDRLLTERLDPPYLQITGPSASSPSDLGDFQKIADADRLSPKFFRTAAMWKLDLYSAMIFLTAQPQVFTTAETASHFPIPPRIARFRISARSKMPNTPPGITIGGDFPLARIFLTRDPSASSPVTTDRMYVQQLCFWSLWTANATPSALLSIADVIAQGAEAINLGVLGLGLTGIAAGTGIAAANTILVNSLLDELSSAYSGGSNPEFWSAA